MKRNTIFIAALLPCLCGVSARDARAQEQRPTVSPVAHARANADDSTTATTSSNDPAGAVGEVEALRRRIEDVEKQNRELLQMLTGLKARMETAGQPGVAAGTHAATAAQPAAATTAPSEPASPPKKADGGVVRWSELLGEGNRIKLYGFLRLDMLFDSQRPNNAQTILFVTSPDPRAGNTSNGDFTMHPRLTRFGIDYTGPGISELGDAKLSGKLEVDFQNGGTESRQAVRVRHAFLKLDWKEVSLLAGQTWDTVSPLSPTVNNDTLQWNAGNVGDRRPQLRLTYEPSVGERGKLSFAGGIGLTGAIDSLDLDANGVRDGEESARPDVQGRAGFSYPSAAKGQRVSLGVSGFYGFLETARPVAGRTSFRSQLVNLDFTLPLHGRLALRGEGWWGRNMSDVRGGAGQGVNAATGREIRGRGGWAEANVKLSRYFALSPGFSTDDPVDADIPAGGRTRNRALFLANRITPSNNFLIGADYLRWKTNYRGLRPGVDNRVNIFFQYSF